MAKMTFNVSLEEFGKKAAEYALDEITYNDLTIREWIEKIASGEFQPVRHANWYAPVSDDPPEWCSNCNERTRWAFDEGYCPNCGAKMDGGADNGNG